MEAPFTKFVIATCITLHIAVFFLVASGHDSETIFKLLAFSLNNFFLYPHTILTSIFFHLEIAHLISNCLAMLFFGSALESEIGTKRTALLFFLGGVIANLASALVYGSDVYFLGASGAIFAILGACMLIKPFQFTIYPYLVPLPLGMLAIIYAIYNAFGALLGASGVSYVGHLAGMFVGTLYGIGKVGVQKGLLIILLLMFIVLLPAFLILALF